MSPIIGLFIAVVAGLVAARPSAVIRIVVPPMIGATAAQSWFLGAGRGHNPASTTTDSPAYWVVQVVIIVAVCGVAAGICWVRRRRAASAGRSVASVAPSAAQLAVATVAAFAATLGLMFVTDRPIHPGSGSGNIPVAGAVAVVIGVVVLVALGVGWLRRGRRVLAG